MDRPHRLPVALVVTAVVGAAVVEVLPDPAPTAAFTLRADAGTDAFVLVHRGGDAVDVRAATLRVRVAGHPLRYQPPPFFAARGFQAGPTGPLNRAGDPQWTVGERSRIRLSGTNASLLDPGDRVTVTLRADGDRVARAVARAR